MTRSRRRSVRYAIGALVLPFLAIGMDAMLFSPNGGFLSVVGLMLGAACAASVFITPRLKIVAVLVYVPAILAILLGIAMLIAGKQVRGI